MGRKGKYNDWLTEDALLSITGWLRDGATDKEVATKKIGINVATFYDWCNRFPEFNNAVKNGHTPLGEKIENTFYSRCEWRQVEETQEEITELASGAKIKKITRKKRWIPPDTAVMIFALKNLKPDKWRDKPVVSNESSEEKHNALIDAIKDMSNNDK